MTRLTELWRQFVQSVELESLDDTVKKKMNSQNQKYFIYSTSKLCV